MLRCFVSFLAVWLLISHLCFALPLCDNETKELDADQLRLLSQRVYGDLDVLTQADYDLVISTLFDKQVDGKQVEELHRLAFLSLIRDTVPQRTEVAAKYAKQCGKITADSDRYAQARSLAVMLQAFRFEAPQVGSDLEVAFWKRFDEGDVEMQKGCLLALQFVSWETDASASLRKKHLLKWFEQSTSDEMRLGIIGCISGATASGKCDPQTALQIFRSLLKTSKATQVHADAMLSQIQVWFAELQLRAIFSGMGNKGKLRPKHEKE